MKQFLLGVLCGFVLLGLAGIILIFAAVRLADRKPAIASNAVLLLPLNGDVPERAPVEIPLPLFEAQSPATVRDIWAGLRRAGADSRVKAVVIAPRQIGAGWAKLQELRDSIQAFRASGKPVYAFLRSASAKDYYLASACDKIWAAPTDSIDLKGLRAEATYLRGTLDKLGIEMDVVHAGKYKDAYDAFTKKQMSPETREVLNQMLDVLFTRLTDGVAEGRKKDPGAVRTLIDQGPFLASDALQDGLVDKLGYEDDLYADVKAATRQTSVEKVDFRHYLQVAEADGSAARVALVVAEGTILQGREQGGFGNTPQVRSATFSKLLRTVRDDNLIKGVIVRIDSPGGDAIASDDILHEMKLLSQAKPTVISMSDVAASGGYFMAVTGDPIVAYPATITGSIGVITAKPVARGLYDKIGLNKELMTRGRFAGLDTDYRPFEPAERAKIEESIEATYRGFVERVAAGRRKSPDEVRSLAEGRVWMGTQAKDHGLVDQLGGLAAALELVRAKAKIAAKEKIALVPYPARRSLIEVLMSRTTEGASLDVQIDAWLDRMTGARWIRPALEGGTLALMPYSIEVK